MPLFTTPLSKHYLSPVSNGNLIQRMHFNSNYILCKETGKSSPITSGEETEEGDESEVMREKGEVERLKVSRNTVEYENRN